MNPMTSYDKTAGLNIPKSVRNIRPAKKGEDFYKSLWCLFSVFLSSRLTQGKSQGGFLHLGIEDKSLSKPQLEPGEGSLWPGLAPSVAELLQRYHRGILCPGEEDQASVQ